MGKLMLDGAVQRVTRKFPAPKTRSLVARARWLMVIDELHETDPNCLAMIALPGMPAPDKPPSSFWHHGYWFKLEYIGQTVRGERQYRLGLAIDPEKTPPPRKRRTRAAAKKRAKVVKKSAAKKAAAKQRASKKRRGRASKTPDAKAPPRGARSADARRPPKQTDTSTGESSKRWVAVLYKTAESVQQVQQLRHSLGALLSSFALSVVNMAKTSGSSLSRVQLAFDAIVDRALGVTSPPRRPNWLLAIENQIDAPTLDVAQIEAWFGQIPALNGLLYTLVKRESPFDWESFWQSCPFGPPEERELLPA